MLFVIIVAIFSCRHDRPFSALFGLGEAVLMPDLARTHSYIMSVVVLFQLSVLETWSDQANDISLESVAVDSSRPTNFRVKRILRFPCS